MSGFAGFSIGPVAVDFPRPSVARVRIGDPAAKQTILDLRAVEALEKVLTRLEAQISLQGIVFTGCAPGRFLAGADVRAIEKVSSESEARALAERGQALFRRIERMPWPTVAAIDGVCLGGGLELSLACSRIVAADSPKTRIGLPEVQLGILPAWGGTTRLPRRIGLAKALEWILTARRASAAAALRDGVIDRAVPAESLQDAALEMLQKDRRPAPRRPRRWSERFLDGTAPGRALVARAARKRVLAQTGRRFPAPLRAIDVAARGLSLPIERALALEAAAAGELVSGNICKELIRIFFLSEDAKKQADRDAAERIGRAAVFGAGVMGAGIAALFAENGIEVRLVDPRAAALDAAAAALRERLRRRVRERRMTEAEAAATTDRFQPSLGRAGVERADVVVEAIVEDLAAKETLLLEVSKLVAPGALIASNTSSLSIGDLQRRVERPERVVGMHFFNPPERMPLVEIVRGERSGAESVAAAAGLALRLGKTPVVTADRPGFLINRILAPYLSQAGALLEEGLSLAEIDAAARAEGMPVGPFELLDEVGLDVAAAAARVLARGLGDRFRATPAVDRLVAAGRLGRKSGGGFYQYQNTARGRAKPAPDPAVPALLHIAWANARRGPRSASLAPAAGRRLMDAIAAEAERALAEGVVDSPDRADLAAVFGIGYPPERGGPLRDRALRGTAP